KRYKCLTSETNVTNLGQSAQARRSAIKKALCESQQVKLATTHTEPMLKINPNGLPPNANTTQILQNSQHSRGKLEHV
ncbi:hypothetical protein HMPREF1572_01372, partial [Gardnerella vaginalis JCP7275]